MRGARCRAGLGTGLVFAFFGAVAATGLSIGGHTETLRRDFGEPHHALARLLGFGVDHVTILGIAQLAESEVLAAAGSHPQDGASLRACERGAHAARGRAADQERLGAQVYPNEILVNLVEREPHALWQHNGELFVIAADGAVIDTMRDARFVSLPLVVGEEANRRTKDYLALLEAAGPLKAQIRAGTLVSGRRWTLKMDNGVDVRLPELRVPDALKRLARLEREQKILQKDVIAVDLRMADRVVVRLTEEAMAARLEGLKKKPLRGKGVDT
jgi:cell division protein FtsQ